ncbi:5-methyltetrahydropteroyltriglutamate-homocysteine methyltransferase [Batrachochytrium salamandrivorans]|nr:5-methyltetrahydropteroyltriglutamate-homocysteine methyltransferase [Batrachochytrium salamandrivorans]
MLHSPHSRVEQKMDPTIKNWMSFAVQKLHEVQVIVKAVQDPSSVAAEMAATRLPLTIARFPLDPRSQGSGGAQEPLARMFRRQHEFATREVVQKAKLNLPAFPHHHCWFLPQTKDVRVARQKFKKAEWTQQQYDDFVKAEIERLCASRRLSVLTCLCMNGWVQSYGSRCIKPPIIFGDVSRPVAMTVDVSVYAQSLTTKPMKGMLTGPVTMLRWSFVRDDQPQKDTTFQIALALRKEVMRPRSTPMCYSDFNDIFQSISDLDADCITIENSKSDLKLLRAFEAHGYTRGIGPGLLTVASRLAAGRDRAALQNMCDVAKEFRALVA